VAPVSSTLVQQLAPEAVRRLLQPRSVVIVGASPTPGSLGASVLANLERFRFKGEIHLVNPKREEIGGRRCLKSIVELPMGVDAAVLAIPRAGVLDALRALAAREVGAAIIFSAGFAESGAAGQEEQREIARIAAEHGMVIEGPNCLGLVNYPDDVVLTFVETPPPVLGEHGSIGIISQSGAMACVLAVILASRALPISYSVSTGNEAASGVEDYVDYLLQDSRTTTLAMIVEQFRQPRRFLDLARRAREANKIIVLLHPGRSSAARASAATHTGALAGDYALMRAKVEAEGVVFAETLEELGDIVEIAHRTAGRSAGGALVITESGAFKALTLDLCERVGLRLPVITDASTPALRAAIPEFVPVSNPLDLTAQGLVDPDLYRRVLAEAVRDERFSAIVLTIIQTNAATCDLKYPPVLAALRDLEIHKPVIVAGLDEGAGIPQHYIDELRTLGVPYLPSAERALRATARLCAPHADAVTTARAVSAPELPELPAGIVPEYRAKSFLGQLGIPFPSGHMVHNLAEAEAVVKVVGYPVALKAQSTDLSHKSDVGGVVLGIADSDALARGWQSLHENLARNRPGLILDGVLVERMGAPGVELIIGGRNDPDWGPMVLAGFGGIQAELTKDVCLLLPGQSRASIISALHHLKSGALFKGFRGAAPLDIEAVATLLESMADLLVARPEIAEIDLNPVIVYPEGRGVIALDALMLVSVVPRSLTP
jgi:acyl-CoA synthetase (NDP forming)